MRQDSSGYTHYGLNGKVETDSILLYRLGRSRGGRPTPTWGGAMGVVAEMDIKKDARNRVTLPSSIPYEHFHLVQHDDGRIELYPRVLVDPTVSLRTLREMDEAMANVAAGTVGEPLDVAALEALADRTP